jgi:hypothetical protein
MIIKAYLEVEGRGGGTILREDITAQETMRNTITKSHKEQNQYIEFSMKSLHGQLFFFCCNRMKMACVTDYPSHLILNFNF